VAPGGGKRLAAAVDSQDEAEIAWAIGEVQRLGIEPARAEAQRLVQRALANLSIFPESPTLNILRDICDFVLDRDK
jgi:geranylgeranyl pyrophosphate synthase